MVYKKVKFPVFKYSFFFEEVFPGRGKTFVKRSE